MTVMAQVKPVRRLDDFWEFLYNKQSRGAALKRLHFKFDFPNIQYVVEEPMGNTSATTMGIHSVGSGYSSVNEYYVMPDDTLLTDEQTRVQYQIEKVEDLIMDEEALEFAFEGYRFYDLLRVALRRNDPTWLANKIMLPMTVRILRLFTRFFWSGLCFRDS